MLTTGYTKAFETDPEFPVLRKPYQISALGRLIHQALYPAQAGIVYTDHAWAYHLGGITWAHHLGITGWRARRDRAAVGAEADLIR